MSRDAKRGYAYLRCATDVNHGVGGSASCHPNRIAEPLVAAAVSEYLSRVTEEAVRQEWVSGSSAASDLEAGHAKHQKALADLQSRRERLALALDGGNMDVTIYRKVDDTLAAQEKTAETAVWNLQAQMEAAPDIEASVAAILLLRDNFKEMVTRLPPAQVVTLLQSAGLVVEIEEGQVVNVRVTT